MRDNRTPTDVCGEANNKTVSRQKTPRGITKAMTSEINFDSKKVCHYLSVFLSFCDEDYMALLDMNVFV